LNKDAGNLWKTQPKWEFNQLIIGINQDMTGFVENYGKTNEIQAIGTPT
jgi:hypothetical protein